MIHYVLTLFILSTLSSHSINADSFQEKDNARNQDNLIISLQKELRTPEYQKEILPNDFSHLSELISFGASTNQPPVYLRSIIKLFSNMLKSSRYVNASAFSNLLNSFALELTPYFTMPISRRYIADAALYDATFVDRFKESVNAMLYAQFSTEYESFRKDPTLFLHQISGSIATLGQEELMQEQLRQNIIKFCEIALSKLIWDPRASETTWHLTKKISEQLVTLLAHNIIDDANDLDDLHWTLLTRYCYFIDLTATDMPESFFVHIRNDLKNNNLVLFALQEEDYILEPKLSYMQRTILEAETAAYRYKAGLSAA